MATNPYLEQDGKKFKRFKIAEIIIIVIVVVLFIGILYKLFLYNTSQNDEDSKKNASAAAATVTGKIVERRHPLAQGSSSGSSNYAETGDGYTSLTKIGDRTYKNYKQGEGSYASNPYWQGTIASDGCGPSSVAIVLSGYGKDYTPGDVVDKIKELGYNMTNSTILSEVLKELGVSNTRLTLTNIDTTVNDIKKNLEAGNAVIAGTSGRTGTYSNGEHWIAIIGLENDQIIVSNPGRTGEAAKMSIRDFVTQEMTFGVSGYILAQ